VTVADRCGVSQDGAGRKSVDVAVDVEALYRKYGPMVLRRCRHLLRDEEKAVDAMQDTFVQVLRREDRLDARAPSSLLYTIATNVCLNVLRSEKRRPQTHNETILANIAAADDPESKVLSRHFLERVFAREMPSTRAIAVMHYVDGMTHEEVAREVGLSVSGVRKRLRTLRARAQELEDV
jgi:RNA polymerase sigma-70 factor (ECF subfamily)